jgi:hypothetical protein
MLAPEKEGYDPFSKKIYDLDMAALIKEEGAAYQSASTAFGAFLCPYGKGGTEGKTATMCCQAREMHLEALKPLIQGAEPEIMVSLARERGKFRKFLGNFYGNSTGF